MNKWTRPFEWSGASAGPAEGRTAPARHHYFAFLSYSHEDSADADWLHQELERFRVPSSIAGRLTGNGVIPRRLTPIFRDRQELAAADDLGEEIREALEASRCLIVLCSPAAARSKWTSAEIEAFKRAHPDGCVIAAIVAGEPFASERTDETEEECLPPPLRQKFDKRGRPTGKRNEPLAADLREGRDGRRRGLLKIVAGILGLALDDLVQRDHLRRQRRLAGIAIGSFAGMFVATALAVTAIEARDSARDQRREAEGLVEFMLGDLKDKLEPIGRLDALDGVGTRVLAYYEKRDTADLSDAALAQRSKALSLMGEVAVQRRDLDGASRLYRGAMAGTGEAIRRQPDDPQRLFDHAQNVFWIGQIAIFQGSLPQAASAFREYKRLADRMVALDPNSIKWRMEVYNAEANLAGVLTKQRRFEEAAALWNQLFRMISALTTADPRNREYRQSLVESLAWYADAERDLGRLANAAALRERHVALLSQLESETGDVTYRQKLMSAQRYLGGLYAIRGRNDDALRQLRSAIATSDRLTATDSENSRPLEEGFMARLAAANILLASGARDEAASMTQAGCELARNLLSKDPTIPAWRGGLRDCLMSRALLASASASHRDASALAAQAVQVARTVKTTDPADDAFHVARALRTLGDVRRASGDAAGAQSAWREAAAVIPRGIAERPDELNERAMIEARVGRRADAAAIRAQLARMGYRST